ncbi:hypothetical protein RJ639_046244 [Escallonia herrerae]|uniref:Phosphoinositide phospholipase C n=1 Tax=Escallonia herrerae TaxID=1293975 RepID=A0AA88W3V8_9ASTE|nr:hypothetical protein RJ639_046244 [Escallonia herrerae]
MGSYNYYKMFGCFNRKFKIREVEPPPDLRGAFERYSSGATHLSADQLLRFLIEFQGEEGCTVSDAERIMHDVLHKQHHLTTFTRHGLTFEDFFHFLFLDDLNAPIKSQVHHDMTAPLQHYFIYTGHNSYLTGNQLSSDCSEIPIIKALERGVRAIELDLWPNSAKDNVHVLHGRTLTTPVTLIKCLRAIKEHAFVKSPYPVIVTLEDHLPPGLQTKVAEMATQTFGEMLYYPQSGCLEEFPSPEALKYHIILSTKPPKEYLEVKHPKEKDSSEEELLGKERIDVTAESEADDRSDSELDDEDGDVYHQKPCQIVAPEYKRLIALKYSELDDEDADVYHQKPCQIGAPEYKRLIALKYKDSSKEELLGKEKIDVTAESEADDRSDSELDDEDSDVYHQNSCPIGAPEYKRLIAIHAGKPKNGVKQALMLGGDKIRRLSLSEQALEKAAASLGTDVVRFTQKNILRVYPKGTRVTSSNFKPLTGWMHGAQMVAFNMQGYGKSLWLMHGMFRSNGCCGYVKKPNFLMKKGPQNEVFDPKVTSTVKKTLRVRVYMGDGWRLDFSHTHFDAYSPPDFYVKIYIVGVPADDAKKKTKVIEDDWTPIWDEEFEFPLTVPELALLRIQVQDYDRSEKDDFGGQTCLPVSELRPGIRAVPLYDKKGEKLKSVKLLMRFQFNCTDDLLFLNEENSF